MQHHFDVDLAVKYGVTEAILLNHFEYWIELNRANEKNFYDGRYWTFNAMKAFAEIFPYLTEKKIRNALKHLQDEGIILTGNFNKSTYDRTLWYAFSDLAESILPKGQMDDAKKANGFTEKGEPIPDNNTYNNSNNNTNKEKRKRFTPPSLDEVKSYCNERNNAVNPEAFVDFYESKGWKVGREPMKDWRAAVRTWERKEANHGRNGSADSAVESQKFRDIGTDL